MIINIIQAGIRKAIGMATLAIITFPMLINSLAEKLSSDCDSGNHVPQNTPITNISKKSAIKFIRENFISVSFYLFLLRHCKADLVVCFLI